MYRSLVRAVGFVPRVCPKQLSPTEKIAIGGEGGWDYLIVDASSGRVYVSHGAEVDVVDTKTGDVAGKITGLHGVHGIALAPEFGRGFISNGQSSTVTIFDLKTLRQDRRGCSRRQESRRHHLRSQLEARVRL